MATKASTPRAATERRVSQQAVPASNPQQRTQPDRRSASDSSTTLSAEQIHNRIAETAYYRAQERGFAPGFEMEDWLAAEAQVEATLSVGRARNN